jgi:hypothetical protein
MLRFSGKERRSAAKSLSALNWNDEFVKETYNLGSKQYFAQK